MGWFSSIQFNESIRDYVLDKQILRVDFCCRIPLVTKENPMQKWEYLLLTVIFDDNDAVRSVTRSGKAILRDVNISILHQYLDRLKDEGWEVESVHAVETAKTYELKRLVE